MKETEKKQTHFLRIAMMCPYDDTDRIIFYDHVYGGQDPGNGPCH